MNDLLEKGADIRSVQELMRHENGNTAQFDIAITDEKLRGTINLLGKNNTRSSSMTEPNMSTVSNATVTTVIYAKTVPPKNT